MNTNLYVRAAVLAMAASALLDARPAASQVTLFRDRDLQGPSMTFNDDVPDLRYTSFGSRRASSIAVPRGCTAVLYEQPYYRGRSTVFRDDDHDLSNTQVGEDRASSLRVNCRGSYPGGPGRYGRPSEQRPEEPEPRWEHPQYPPHPGEAWRGVVLFRDRGLEGPREYFNRDVPDLDLTRFGSRMASSLDVSPGCVAVLYERPGYGGRRTEFRERDNNLKNTSVGEDAVSSLRIRCP